ncbi:MAG: phage holin family protein [Solirubrobacterales bacterium]
MSAASGPGPPHPGAGQRSGSEPPRPQGAGGPQNIATAITDVSERVAVLVREEVELAKAEVAEKASKLAKGAVVGLAAGIFFITALFFVLIGCAWLLYYYLPIGSQFTYFVGFFAMALILVVLGAIAGLVAAKVVKKSAPPVPTMAIEEARLIRETMGASAEPDSAPHGAQETW